MRAVNGTLAQMVAIHNAEFKKTTVLYNATHRSGEDETVTLAGWVGIGVGIVFIPSESSGPTLLADFLAEFPNAIETGALLY